MLARTAVVSAVAMAAPGCDVVFGSDFPEGPPPVDAYQHDADLSGCLRDTFHDGVIDEAKWRLFDRESSLVVSEPDGVLAVDIGANVLGTNGLASVMPRDVTGGQLVANVLEVPPAEGDAYLALVVDFEHAYAIFANETRIRFQTIAPTAAPPVDLPYVATEMQYWRIVYLMIGPDAVMNFDTSPDGLRWVNRHGETTQHVPVTALEVDIGARAVSSIPIASRATFDNLQLVTTGCPLL